MYKKYPIYVTSFIVLLTKVTLNVGLKDVVRMETSIPSLRCLFYKPERIRTFKPSIQTQEEMVHIM